MDLQYILGKYGDIIKEEVNVKQVKPFDKDLNIEKIFVPIGSIISSKFGKDTGQIIKYAKMGKIEELEDNKVKVIGDDKKWILDKDDYQIRYSGDIDTDSMIIDQGIVVKLNLNIDEELKKEGLIREISRFLNQLRKEAGYNVDDRVVLFVSAKNIDFWKELFKQFEEFLKNEVLILDIKETDEIKNVDIQGDFDSDYGKMIFGLKKI